MKKLNLKKPIHTLIDYDAFLQPVTITSVPQQIYIDEYDFILENAPKPKYIIEDDWLYVSNKEQGWRIGGIITPTPSGGFIYNIQIVSRTLKTWVVNDKIIEKSEFVTYTDTVEYMILTYVDDIWYTDEELENIGCNFTNWDINNLVEFRMKS